MKYRFGGIVVYFFVEAASLDQVQQLIRAAQAKFKAWAMVEEAEVETFRSAPTKYHITLNLRLRPENLKDEEAGNMAFRELRRVCHAGFWLPTATKVRLQPYLAPASRDTQKAEGKAA